MNFAKLISLSLLILSFSFSSVAGDSEDLRRLKAHLDKTEGKIDRLIKGVETDLISDDMYITAISNLTGDVAEVEIRFGYYEDLLFFSDVNTWLQKINDLIEAYNKGYQNASKERILKLLERLKQYTNELFRIKGLSDEAKTMVQSMVNSLENAIVLFNQDQWNRDDVKRVLQDIAKRKLQLTSIMPPIFKRPFRFWYVNIRRLNKSFLAATTALSKEDKLKSLRAMKAAIARMKRGLPRS